MLTDKYTNVCTNINGIQYIYFKGEREETI